MAKPLLPDRHPDRNFFICDFGDVIPKSDIASMEHPLFTLATKPDTTIRHYEHNESSVSIVPSILGHATIHDKDILIYAISQLMAGINQGERPNRKIRFKAHDLLVTTNRQTSGQGYKLFKTALDRLAGTLITTNIKTDGKKITKGFGIIDSYEIVTENEETKRMVELEITLSEWLFNAVLGQEVLSINRKYFRLRKSVERRIYEIARKHCGTQKKWAISIKKLHKKVGSSGAVNRFKSEIIKPIVNHNHLPDYRVSLDGDNVVFSFAGNAGALSKESDRPHLKPDTIEKARKIIGRNYDIYGLETEWLAFWKSSGCPEFASPDGAFIGFCKNRVGNDSKDAKASHPPTALEKIVKQKSSELYAQNDTPSKQPLREVTESDFTQFRNATLKERFFQKSEAFQYEHTSKFLEQMDAEGNAIAIQQYTTSGLDSAFFAALFFPTLEAELLTELHEQSFDAFKVWRQK